MSDALFSGLYSTLPDLDAGIDLDFDDTFGSMYGDEGIDDDLDDLEADAEAEAEYGSMYGAIKWGGVAYVPATVDVVIAKHRFLWPAAFQLLAEQTPDLPIKQVTSPLSWGIKTVENEAYNLARELQQAVENVGGAFPANFPDQVDAIRALAVSSIFPDADDVEVYEQIGMAWDSAEDKDSFLSGLQAVISPGTAWDVVVGWYTEDLPTFIQTMAPAAQTGHEALNSYAGFLLLADLAGASPFEAITEALVDQQTPDGRTAIELGGMQPSRQPSRVITQPQPGYTSDDIAPKDQGWLDKIKPTHVIAAGVAVGIAWPIVRDVWGIRL